MIALSKQNARSWIRSSRCLRVEIFAGDSTRRRLGHGLTRLLAGALFVYFAGGGAEPTRGQAWGEYDGDDVGAATAADVAPPGVAGDSAWPGTVPIRELISSPVEPSFGDSYSQDTDSFRQYVSDDLRRCPTWTGQVDALFLWMGNIPSRTLFIDKVTRQPVFDADEAQTEAAIAPRYALLFSPNQCRALEVNYFQVQSFPGDAALPSAASQYEIYDIAGIPPFEPINDATLTTSAQIKSLEGNLRFSEGGPIRWLVGFRWVQWNQTMRIDDTFTDILGRPGQDSILVNTGNNLYGGQLGCDAMLWNRDEGFQVNGVAKAGVFGNAQAFQRTNVSSTTPGVSGDVASVADQTAFFGELGVNASMAVTNWLSWRVGYTFFWLSGVATPANQLALTDIGSLTTSIDTEGSVLLHGVTTGLEARW